MKRTKHISLNNMRKKTRRQQLKPLSLLVSTLLLTSCSSTEQTQVYRDEFDCMEKNPGMQEECKTAFANAQAEAVKTAPKFENRNDCEEMFGRNNCTSYQGSSGSSWFMPAMAGFLLGRALDGPGFGHYQPMFTSYSYRSPYRDRWITADGRSYGNRMQKNIRTRTDTFKRKPVIAKTLSRGGFGSIASAKSKWGSSRGGWGG